MPKPLSPMGPRLIATIILTVAMGMIGWQWF